MDPYRSTREGSSHLLTVTLIKEDGYLASYPPVTTLFKFKKDLLEGRWELYNVNRINFGTFLGKARETISHAQGDCGPEPVFMAQLSWIVGAMPLTTVQFGPQQLSAFMSEKEACATFDKKEI